MRAKASCFFFIQGTICIIIYLMLLMFLSMIAWKQTLVKKSYARINFPPQMI